MAHSALCSCRELELLTAMQHRAARNHFRLREADRRLRARVAPARPAGAILADALQAERQRLGRELHTGVGQALAGIHIHAGIAESQWPDSPEPARKTLEQIVALADIALEQVRGVSRRLYVPAWQALPLVTALQNLWDASGVSLRFEASLDLQQLSMEPPPE